MSYTPPILNLLASAWIPPHAPATDPPDVTNIPCQLYLRSRASFFLTPSQTPPYIPALILRTAWPRGVLGPYIIIEIPAEDPGTYYYIAFSDPAHLGFSNVYTASPLIRCDAAGTAIVYN